MSASVESLLEVPVPDERRARARRVVEATAAVVASDVDKVAAEIAQSILAAVEQIPDDASTRIDTERQARDAVLAFCDWVAESSPLDAFRVPRSGYEFARILARRGVPVNVLLRVHRLGLAAVVDAFEHRLDRSETKATLLDAARLATDLAFAAHDVQSEEVCREYLREREAWTRGAGAIRRETVEAVLAEQPVDPDQASRALLYELRRHHVGLVVWGSSETDATDCPPGALQAAATRIATELGSTRPLLLQRSDRTLWAWVGLQRPPEPEALQRFAHIYLADGARAAIGDHAHGIAGFRRTHREAVDTAKVAALGGRRPGSVTSFHAVELAAFMADDVARTRRFVQHQLGPLGQDDDEHARLRVTLMLYLEEHGSRIATARRLGIHPNTVANRIRACREMLEHDLSHRQVHLQVALSLGSTLGSAVLSPGHKRS